MDHFSARDATRLGAHSRRWRMRERARSQHAAPPAPDPAPDPVPLPGRYQTPEWLDRSFVLPLTRPEGTDVPSQPVRRHDDDPAPESRMRPEVPRQLTRSGTPPTTPQVTADVDAGAAPEEEIADDGTFVRPASTDIDFGRVVRRSDLCRAVTRLHWVATGLTGLALLLYLLFGSTAALVAVVVLAVVALGAFGVRLWLNRAPVPRVHR